MNVLEAPWRLEEVQNEPHGNATQVAPDYCRHLLPKTFAQYFVRLSASRLAWSMLEHLRPKSNQGGVGRHRRRFLRLHHCCYYCYWRSFWDHLEGKKGEEISNFLVNIKWSVEPFLTHYNWSLTGSKNTWTMLVMTWLMTLLLTSSHRKSNMWIILSKSSCSRALLPTMRELEHF